LGYLLYTPPTNFERMKLLILTTKIFVFIFGYLALGYSLGREQLLPAADPLQMALERTEEQWRTDLDILQNPLTKYAAAAARLA